MGQKVGALHTAQCSALSVVWRAWAVGALWYLALSRRRR